MASEASPGLGSALARQIPSQALRAAAFLVVGQTVGRFLGPTGIALMGQVQNLLALGTVPGAQALQTGFQQGTARRAGHPHQREAWIGAGLVLAGAGCLFGFALAGLAVASGRIVLPPGTRWIVLLLPLALPAAAWVGAWQGAALGAQRYGEVARWTALAALTQAGLVLLGTLAGPGGFAAALILSPLPAAVLTRFLPPRLAVRLPRRLAPWVRAWAPLAAAGLVPALLAPLLGLALRSLALRSGWDAAGRWQAAVRLTDFVFPLWHGAVAAWLLSRLSGSEGRGALRHALARGIGGAVLLAGATALAAPLLLPLGYGPGFAQAAPLLRLQAAAEIPRAAAWLLSTALVARGRPGAAVGLEFAGAGLLAAFAFALEPRLGTLALPLAAGLENLATAGLGLVLLLRRPLGGIRA